MRPGALYCSKLRRRLALYESFKSQEMPEIDRQFNSQPEERQKMVRAECLDTIFYRWSAFGPAVFRECWVNFKIFSPESVTIFPLLHPKGNN